MRRVLLILLVLTPAACQRYEGPREVYQKNRAGDRADLPGYTIEEQKQRGRERCPTLQDNPKLYPNGNADSPGGIGR
jgi:hypothetical protein